MNPKAKIMLVEDSQNLRLVLKDYLEMVDYEVFDFENGQSASAEYKEGLYDLCILDVMMPEKDGFWLAQHIRIVDLKTPIIFLTAKTSKEDKIKGFKLGCDDYITKPFNTDELNLRIEAILRRSKQQQSSDNLIKPESKILKYKLADIVFDYHEMELITPQERIRLTKKQAKLLQYLCEHKNQLIQRSDILRDVWNGDAYETGRSMDVFITKLRAYLDPDNLRRRRNDKLRNIQRSVDPKVQIVNVHGTGFILKVKE